MREAAKNCKNFPYFAEFADKFAGRIQDREDWKRPIYALAFDIFSNSSMAQSAVLRISISGSKREWV